MAGGATTRYGNFITERIGGGEYRRDNFFNDGRFDSRLSQLGDSTTARIKISAALRRTRTGDRKFFAALHSGFDIGGDG